MKTVPELTEAYFQEINARTKQFSDVVGLDTVEKRARYWKNSRTQKRRVFPRGKVWNVMKNLGNHRPWYGDDES